jgi:Na+-driven multidrug efflux pump
MTFGLLMTLCGIFIPDAITGILCDPTHTFLYEPTFTYLRITLLGTPVFMLMWALCTMAGVDGSPRLVSFAILIDNAVNLSCDIIFIKFLDMGIAGSSLATVVGHLVGIAIMCWHFHYKDNHLHLGLGHSSSPLWKGIKDILSEGAPLAIASICLTLLLFSSNSIMLSSLGRVGIFAFAVCMNLLQVYNLFLSGTCQTLQSLGAIQVGKKNEEGLHTILRRAFRFITAAMAVTCILVWAFPESIARLFGAEEATMLTECSHALRIFALSFIPFCYIYVIMIVYKLYGQHRMALFISFALSLTVIPVLWLVARIQPSMLWYSYLIAYLIEAVAIYTLHRMNHVELKLKI